MSPQIKTLKTELREFIALSETITPGVWQNVSRVETSDIIGSDDVCGGVYIASVSRIAWGGMDSERGDANATFIARSHNISPTMAKMLLAQIGFLERWAVPVQEANKQLKELLNLWNETK